MGEANKKLNQKIDSYSPSKPLIIDMVQKIAESSSEIPAIEIYRAYREPYQVLGMENKFPNENRDPDCSARWAEFDRLGVDKKIAPFMTENILLGVFCQSDQGYYNYLLGGIVSGVGEIPEGLFLADFPASEYFVVTHEWVQSDREAIDQVGRIVGYAHGPSLILPDGYEKYTDPIMFIESYNYEFEKGRFRFEVWLPIRKGMV